MAVNQLAVKTSRVMRGSHSHKTAAFVRSVRRQGSLAFSLFGCLLAHGELRNNKLNLWNLSHTRTSVRTLEFIKRQAQQPDMVQHLTLQSRT
ncbi:VPS35 endosomal protein sorting factor-like isoform X1 [Oncorhynchus mykiss]|uniref:VPS35 endosomal protein sorting factor-like isoform X1 n=2 Tax=Oncorhynchus mykiss TaxID=8022 RepID=UPI001878D68C|nr:VPS35 endosomal protein sorting factor-like isoform X1 [Oncorhynchus mykiss]